MFDQTDVPVDAPAIDEAAAPTSLSVLQPFLTPGEGDPVPLYVKDPRSELTFVAGSAHNARGGVISFDSYFNSFYEAYWRRYTRLRRIALQVSGRGRCWCTIRREAAEGSSSVVRHDLLTLGAGDPVTLHLDLDPDDDLAARLFVEFGSLGGPLTLEHLAWTTPEAPVRPVTVGVALCTFNREDFIARTVQRLLEVFDQAALGRIVVVNQGEPFRDPRLERIVRSEPLRVLLVDQPNFGGAGGFTRGAMELLKAGAATHVLFMDDDIELDPRHLVTTAAFAAYAAEPVVVGGQMLDLFKRSLMFESGSCVTHENLLKANHRDLSLERPVALRDVAEVLPSDFNGWWYSLIPARCFEDHGLPAPVFIRGDDQEFGVRLQRCGVTTVSVPPISVWHEPFNAKPPGWQLYYDLRNRLIFASLYPDRYRLDGVAALLKRLLAMLIRYDYQQTSSIVLALRDFLAGPAGMAEGAPQTHKRVLARLERHAPERMTRCEGLPLADEAAPKSRWGGRLRLASTFIRLCLGVPRQNRAGEDCLIYAEMPRDLMHLGRCYVLSDDGDHFFLRFRYAFSRNWAQLFRTALTIGRYGVQHRRAAALWRQEMPGLTTFASWSTRLGLDEWSELRAAA